MVDIARVFSPVVVLESSEARPKSSDRIRSASVKRVTSADARRIPRVSSAVSTIEGNNHVPGRYVTNDISVEKDLEAELKAELTTPLTGINLRELINEKISKLDRSLRAVGASSDASKKKASLISEKLRADAVRNGQSRQQVHEFAGLLATKSASHDPMISSIKPKETVSTVVEQDQSTLLEIFKYPGFHEDHVTPLPFRVALDRQVMRYILSKQYTLAQQAPYIQPLIKLYHSEQTKALIMVGSQLMTKIEKDIFWWVFLENYQNQPEIQKKLLDRASQNYISLLMMEIDLRYRDKCFQVYSSLLAETVFACFKVCFPSSVKRMPADVDAARKTKDENENKPSEFTGLSDTPGQRTKDLVNLDGFKNSIVNVCQLWLGGIPAPPRRYEKWRSKLVQQEKISFTESTPTTKSITGATTPHTSLTVQSSSRGSVINDTKHANNDHAHSSSHHVSFERTKRKEPNELLKEIYKHTNDPLPDRRVLFEDYRFDMNGNSPLAEKFLRSSHMLKKAGTQFFISHPQITQVPTVNAETYDKEIQRTAQFCRIVRAQKHKVRAKEEHHRKLVRQHVAKLAVEDARRTQEKQASLYRRKMMNFHHDEFETLSQVSVKFHD